MKTSFSFFVCVENMIFTGMWIDLHSWRRRSRIFNNFFFVFLIFSKLFCFLFFVMWYKNVFPLFFIFFLSFFVRLRKKKEFYSRFFTWNFANLRERFFFMKTSGAFSKLSDDKFIEQALKWFKKIIFNLQSVCLMCKKNSEDF